MAELIEIKLFERKDIGKGWARKIRRQGRIPAVFYGPEYPGSLPVEAEGKALSPLLNSSRWETLTLNVTLPDGKKEMAIAREIQRDPLTGRVLHIDFYQLMKGHRVRVNIPIQLHNRESAPGIKKGGVLEHLLHEIEMEVLPGQIPDVIPIDLSKMELNAELKVKDIPLPEGVELVTDPESVILLIAAPREAEEAAPAALEEEEPKEVEVVGKGKAKKEEEE